MTLILNKVNLEPQFYVNLLWMKYIVTLKVFHLLFINLYGIQLSLYMFSYLLVLDEILYIVWKSLQSLWKVYFIRMITLKIFCLKCFRDNMHLVKENVPAVEKKGFFLFAPYLKVLFLQARTKLQKTFKRVLNCLKLEIAFKSQSRPSNSFWLKEPISRDLIFWVVSKF